MATTIPKTVEVPTAALVEACGYFEHLADVIGALNDGQSTSLDNSLNLAAERLFKATGLDWDKAGWRVVDAARARFTKQWASEMVARCSDA
jgi:hypothetical protein